MFAAATAAAAALPLIPFPLSLSLSLPGLLLILILLFPLPLLLLFRLARSFVTSLLLLEFLSTAHPWLSFPSVTSHFTFTFPLIPPPHAACIFSIPCLL